MRRPTPHGVGGLKYLIGEGLGDQAVSHPPRGGWIEMTPSVGALVLPWSHPPRGGWIEISSIVVILP